MNNVAKFRDLKNLRQGDLAAMVGVSQPHISRIENGDEGPPLALFREIANALGVTLADLFADDRSESELALLEIFRQLPDARKQGWIDMARAVLSEPGQADTKKVDTDLRPSDAKAG